ncbi:unnamed protein product [Didymodactylos carnosus]|uniref:Uncharacterized protein n=1 Tax=Didymodactylos carnosus TaxID=1234261 RepID=A0A815ISL4_9BILA|nr:unnamed protein product [Didymodactylos carnosus]CAF4260415.1 unnamed protein product [Didymodactylos carnosus]
MNTKLIILTLFVFGITIAQCGRIKKRYSSDDSSDDSGQGDDGDDLDSEKRAISQFLQDQDEANEFLERRNFEKRLFSSDPLDKMKEAKKAYEKVCERTFHATRWCPDLSTWKDWQQAWLQAGSGKK